MPLPNVLTSAPLLWSAKTPFDTQRPVCKAKCHRSIEQCPRQDNWCWAAVLQEALRCLRSTAREQCDLAQEHLRSRLSKPALDCRCPCGSDDQEACNKPAHLETIIRSATDLVPRNVPVSRWSPSGFCALLDRNQRTLLIGRFEGEGVDHYTLLAEVATDAPKRFLVVADPLKGRLVRVPFPSNGPIRHDRRFLRSVFEVV